MEAGKRNITDIFNRMRVLQIPYFQRAYVWEEDNWERLLNDLQAVARTRSPYFLGSVILKQRPTGADGSAGDVRIVIDGQQRLTTLLLFFKVLYAARGQDEMFKATFFNFAHQLMLDHNRLDKPIFEAILNNALTAEFLTEYASNNVLAAYRYFESKADNLKSIDPLVLLGNVYFVGIDLGADEDEQQIFNTINSLGVSLSTAELLKNDLFNRKNASVYEATWLPAFESSEDDRLYWTAEITAGREHRENIDLFMQSYLLMIVNSPDDVRVDALYASYKQYLAGTTDRGQFIEDLTKCARIYKRKIDPAIQDRQVAKQDWLERLTVIVFGLSTTTVVPYILYLLHASQPEERAAIFPLLEGYLVRRVICRETSKNYNRLFGAWIKGGVKTVAAFKAALIEESNTVNRYPDDSVVPTSVKTSTLTNKQALVVLWLLELSIRNDQRQSTALSGLSHYSLEHLMPKKWRNHWGTLPPLQASERDHALQKLGNLSLLASGLNTSISDSAWDIKKHGSGKHKGLLEYATGLETLSEDLKLSEWNENTIAQRAERLTSQILSTWPSPI
ncbi:MAG TPA: DUF262 domain-containing HNH endonuclease family protein [Pseudolabrys sp.]|uniref:DUF262 domain-containing protein n=1 Tax=Pseudolabrys sp. TaxID=1960880 RepID=UPI002DDD8C96|nr:DUF262 domain-containing HNH endonuclease family protein [Pseudolabrys sp.]HEV2628631.1 DUF262 domain-containing HNH endonuclease family protein [Pseudolabrys sp.]